MSDNRNISQDRAEEIRKKYQQERERRLKKEGTDQYNFAEGALEHFADDPYAGEPPAREALVEDLDVLVIGGGFGGLQAGATFRKNGIDNFRILDIAADFGGTWYWNRYPGLRCDVESYIYLPFLEETGYMPTERYVRGSEIFAYCQLLGRQFDLYDRALFQTKVAGMEWNEGKARWIVQTDRGDRFAARFVTTQSGIFSRPQLPGIPGIADFKGHIFHSARWDYDYTGGTTEGNLTGLADKDVGVMGTGATGLQVIPQLAKSARSVTVFQRTPTAVGVRDNGPTDPEWFKSLPKGWQKAREKSFTDLSSGRDVECDLDDGWARFFRRMVEAAKSVPAEEQSAEAIGEAQEIADYEYNEIVRARVEENVSAPETAAKLKAYYRTLCKRPGFSDEYLPIFNRDNVELVDVSGGVDRISESGVVVDGKEYTLDCLVLCTGFELGTTWSHQAGYDIKGRNGALISEKWAQGLVTYHGLFSHGFPNIFFMGLTQTGTTISVPHMLQEQVDHLTFIILHCLQNGCKMVETTKEAEAGWQDVIAEKNELRRPFQEACTPGYFNAEGKAEDRRSAIGSGMYFPASDFFEMWENWRRDGNFAGLTIS
ncbi:MAG: NAD(P)/FAD-dependent oxidoreductase [Novosphingobium sp.]|nr:NAD(P)/FAD-dependent oxidoreductase [Novosphingobium sp.]